MTEKEAYDAYVKSCHDTIGLFVSEFSFPEWQKYGRPKTARARARESDGYWPTPWKETDAR